MAGGKAEGTSTPVSHTLHVETQTQPPPPPPPPLRKIISVASIAVGIQFGWALQISLLTPYVQLLGIPHKWASLIWLCGPISGLIVQPIAGHFSDRSTSRFGRRRPFLALGSLLVTVAVFLIGYAADLGHLLGDSLSKTPKTRAIAIFALGFWILDIANYMLGGPCRAFLADLAAGSESKTRTANAFFTFFTALGSVLGYSTGMYTRLHEIFPFTLTAACDVYCANLKSCFFLSITLLLIITVATLLYVNEDKPCSPCDNNADNASDVPFIGEILRALKGIKRPMWILMIVTALNWLAVTPFLLFNTDWMGREVYGGDPTGNAESKGLYNAGVSAGALGLLLNALAVGFMSLCVEWIGRKMGGAKRLWGATNLVMAVCLVMMVPVTKLAEAHRRSDAGAKTYPAAGVRAAALALFGLLGIPQAVTLSIPYAMASIFSSNSGVGQGLSQGVLNLAIVTPQMLVSLGGGPIDQLFGGGNLPLYVVAAIAATTAGVLAFTFLPSPSPEKTTPLPRH